MTLSFQSDTFRTARKSLDVIASEKGTVTSDDIMNVVKQSGVTLKEFQDANKDFKSFKGRFETEEEALNFLEPSAAEQSYFLPVSRAVIETGKGVANLADTALRSTLNKETYKGLKKSIEDASDYIPDNVKKALDATFDPYHGDGIIGDVNRGAGELGSYFIGGFGAAKLGNKLLTSNAAAPAVSRLMGKLGSKSKTAVKGGAYGLAGAIGTTVVENPKQNSVDAIYALFDDDAKNKLIEYQNNPTDPELSDYFNALLKNIAFEVPLGASFFGGPALLTALAKKHSARIGTRINNVSTRLGKITAPIGKTKVGRKAKQYFTSRMGTDDATLERLIKRDAASKSAFFKANGYASDLETSIQKNLKQQLNNNPNYAEEVIDKAMKGDADAMSRLASDSVETANIVKGMRQSIDKLSNRLSKTQGISSNLSATIDKNLGTYMIRSYEFFDNPEYKKLIQERLKKRLVNPAAVDAEDTVLKNAAEFIANKMNVPSTDPIVQDSLEKIIGLGADGRNGFADFLEQISNKQYMSTSGKPLFKRKEIPVEMRELFGEVKDPSKNFIKTYEKLSVLNAENKFLEEMAVSLESKFQQRVRDIQQANPTFTPQRVNQMPKDTMGDVSNSRDDVLKALVGQKPLSDKAIKNPLQGVYADEEYAKVLRDGLDIDIGNNIVSKLLNGAAAAKGVSQKIKTVYNPATHVKNVVGNVAMLGANGMLPKGMSVSKALESSASELLGKSNSKLGQQLAEYSDLGITNSNIGLGEIRKNLSTISKDVDGWLNKRVAGKAVGKIDDKLTQMYQAEDDFFKIVHFEKTLDYLKKAYPEIAEQNLKRMAAQRTRDMMPNYGLVPKAIKALRYSPVGDFVAFPAEMIRTSKNLAKYTIQDLASGNKVLGTQAAKRLGGMTAVGMAPRVAAFSSRLVNDIDGEQADAIDMTGPSYEINSDKIYLSGVNKDKNGHLGVDYVNIGAYDPYMYLKSFAKNTHDLILSGTGMDPEATSFEFNKTAVALADQTLSPFLGTSMLTDAFLDSLGGKTASEATVSRKLDSIGDTILDIGDPFILKFLEKRKQYEASGKTDYYSSIPESATEWPAIFGFKKQRADFTAGARFNFNPAFNKITKADNLMNDSLTKPNVTSPEEIFKDYKDVQSVRLEGFRDIKSMVELYSELGMDEADIINAISLDETFNIDKDRVGLLEAASNNMFIPYMPKETPALFKNKTPVPWNAMIDLYGKLEGREID